MQNTIKFTALLNAALLLTGAGVAQAPAQKAATPNSQAPQQVAAIPQQPSSPQNDTPHTAPVFWITSVEVLRSTHAPQLDVVRVRGLVPTEGWESAELVPITRGTPSDGILDLALIAEAPSDSTVPSAYPEMEAVFAIEPGHPFKGVRVHGAANRVVLKNLPGYAEAGDPPKGCVACSGKLFVAKGQNAPAGRAADTVVHEEELPQNLRIIRESDGIGSIDSNPNRMTILLNEKGEIITAMWD